MGQILYREPVRSLLDEIFFFNRAGWPAPRTGESPSAVRAKMDVVDKGDTYAVAVELPGVRKEDIQVSIDGAQVAIVAENKAERDVKDGEKVLHTERFATRYARRFELPEQVTEDGADAAFEDGVLRLALPKRAQVASKRLTVR